MIEVKFSLKEPNGILILSDLDFVSLPYLVNEDTFTNICK